MTDQYDEPPKEAPQIDYVYDPAASMPAAARTQRWIQQRLQQQPLAAHPYSHPNYRYPAVPPLEDILNVATAVQLASRMIEQENQRLKGAHVGPRPDDFVEIRPANEEEDKLALQSLVEAGGFSSEPGVNFTATDFKLDDEHSTWMNPLESMDNRFEIARGAIHFRDRTIANLRNQLRAAVEELDKTTDTLAAVYKSAVPAWMIETKNRTWVELDRMFADQHDRMHRRFDKKPADYVIHEIGLIVAPPRNKLPASLGGSAKQEQPLVEAEPPLITPPFVLFDSADGNRIYPEGVLKAAVARVQAKGVDVFALIPASSQTFAQSASIDKTRVAGTFENLDVREGKIYGQLRLLKTEMGDVVRNYIESTGQRPNFGIRGFVKDEKKDEGVVVSELDIICWDIIS